jgi:putative nucleotidyltransferase with HDIG domain
MDHSSSFLDFLVTLYDPHGDAHAVSVSDQAVALANAAGLSARDIQHIEAAARYHDIGKIAIPENIRRYPGTYTSLERHTMQEHAQIGAQLLQLLNFEPPVISIVLSHHENYDGSGYPSMLRRENIPIGARIIRIVDSFDALTHSRGYRAACSKKRALEKLEEVRHHYDPELLDLFVGVVRSTWETMD